MLSFIVGLCLYIGLDYLRINHIAQKLIQEEVGPLLTRYPDKLAGLIVRISLVLGIYVFALQPANGRLIAAVYGALFGMITYTIYECTNKALLQGRTRKLAIFDIARGTLACGLINTLMFIVQS